MAYKLHVTKYIDKPKNPPIKLKIERVLDTPTKPKRVYKKKTKHIQKEIEETNEIPVEIIEAPVLKQKRKYTPRAKKEKIEIKVEEVPKVIEVTQTEELPQNVEVIQNDNITETEGNQPIVQIIANEVVVNENVYNLN